MHRRAAPYGVPGQVADGNDVVAVYEATASAVRRARDGGGPTLLEFRTFRWLEHCGPNDDTAVGVRSAADVDAWRERCPIARARRFVSDEDDRRIRSAVAAEIEAALAAARQAPWPTPTWRPAYYEV